MKLRLAGLLTLLMVIGACDKSTTAPSTTTTTPTTPAPDLVNEVFSGAIGVGATTYFPFSVAQSGTVTATLSSIGGAGVPSTVQVRLGIGTLDAVGCNAIALSLVNTASPTLTATEAPGAYCVNVTDVGNLFATASFTIIVTHP